MVGAYYEELRNVNENLRTLKEAIKRRMARDGKLLRISQGVKRSFAFV